MDEAIRDIVEFLREFPNGSVLLIPRTGKAIATAAAADGTERIVAWWYNQRDSSFDLYELALASDASVALGASLIEDLSILDSAYGKWTAARSAWEILADVRNKHEIGGRYRGMKPVVKTCDWLVFPLGTTQSYEADATSFCAFVSASETLIDVVELDLRSKNLPVFRFAKSDPVWPIDAAAEEIAENLFWEERSTIHEALGKTLSFASWDLGWKPI